LRQNKSGRCLLHPQMARSATSRSRLSMYLAHRSSTKMRSDGGPGNEVTARSRSMIRLVKLAAPGSSADHRRDHRACSSTSWSTALPSRSTKSSPTEAHSFSRSAGTRRKLPRGSATLQVTCSASTKNRAARHLGENRAPCDCVIANSWMPEVTCVTVIRSGAHALLVFQVSLRLSLHEARLECVIITCLALIFWGISDFRGGRTCPQLSPYPCRGRERSRDRESSSSESTDEILPD
jgi:hypothetical protein